jgi:hypothetical protein
MAWREKAAVLKRRRGLLQMSAALCIGVVAVIVPGGMDRTFMKRREAQEDKYWKSVEERLIVARAKDAEYTARGLVDPGPSSARAKKGSRSRVSSEAHEG